MAAKPRLAAKVSQLITSRDGTHRREVLEAAFIASPGAHTSVVSSPVSSVGRRQTVPRNHRECVPVKECPPDKECPPVKECLPSKKCPPGKNSCRWACFASGNLV